MPIKLNDSHTFLIELYQNKVRLVVLNHGEEWVCRKETFKNLNDFLATADGSLFKGRLQLYKQHQDIQVWVKGETVGTIRACLFESKLNEFKKT